MSIFSIFLDQNLIIFYLVYGNNFVKKHKFRPFWLQMKIFSAIHRLKIGP
jgi:hypothetical protein